MWLTDRNVAAIEPPAKGYEITYDQDGGPRQKRVPGFGLRVTMAGAKSWVFNYRNADDRERRMTIGGFPTWTAAQARERAKDLRREVDQGIDPLQARQAQREAPTMGDLLDRYIAEHLPKKRRASAREDEGLIKQWARPELGMRKVASITRRDIDDLFRKVTAAGTPIRANRLLALLGKAFTLAIRWEMRPESAGIPTRGVERNRENKRRRYLKPDELQKLVAVLAEHPNRDAARAISLLLLTGARRGEVLHAQWSHFDLADGMWHKPAAATKQGMDHSVPLNGAARAVLAELRREVDDADKITAQFAREAEGERHPKRKAAKLNAAAWARAKGTSDFLFPSRTAIGKPFLNLHRQWDAIRTAAGIADVRAHDLRHSFASYLASSGHSLVIIGAMLGHRQAQTTARYAHLLTDPLRKAAETVGAFVAGGELVAGEVLEIAARKS
jgi:integrase